MLTWIIRSFLLLLLFMAIRTVIRKLLAPWMGTQTTAARSPSTRTIRGQTVRDPQCGMYVATDLAIQANQETETLYFCSESCRDAYLSQQRVEVG